MDEVDRDRASADERDVERSEHADVGVRPGLAKALDLVREQTGSDFAGYKASLLSRRFERRRALLGRDEAEYLRLLAARPSEVSRLADDLLVGVTSFFRDAEAFAVVAAALPELLLRGPSHETRRVWVAGCSTGEEAYSIAIMVREAMEDLGIDRPVQIFGTDACRAAIATARTGRYAEDAVERLDERRRARFERDGRGLRVEKAIRDMVVFEEQNLIADPWFRRIDLLVCRNVLIYLGASAQRRVLTRVHDALRPGGLLFLGTCETVGALPEAFEVLDGPSKLFQRREREHLRARARCSPDRSISGRDRRVGLGQARYGAARSGEAGATSVRSSEDRVRTARDTLESGIARLCAAVRALEAERCALQNTNDELRRQNHRLARVVAPLGGVLEGTGAADERPGPDAARHEPDE